METPPSQNVSSVSLLIWMLTNRKRWRLFTGYWVTGVSINALGTSQWKWTFCVGSVLEETVSELVVLMRIQEKNVWLIIWLIIVKVLKIEEFVRNFQRKFTENGHSPIAAWISMRTTFKKSSGGWMQMINCNLWKKRFKQNILMAKNFKQNFFQVSKFLSFHFT